MRFAYLKIPTAVLITISALFFPFSVTVILFVLGTFLFRNFYFGMFILFFMDAVYALEGIKFTPFYGMITVLGILAFLAISMIKERIFNLE